MLIFALIFGCFAAANLSERARYKYKAIILKAKSQRPTTNEAGFYIFLSLVGRIQDPNFSSCIFEIFFRLDPTDFEKRLQKQSPIKDMSDPLSPTLLDCPSAEVSDKAMAMEAVSAPP